MFVGRMLLESIEVVEAIVAKFGTEGAKMMSLKCKVV